MKAMMLIIVSLLMSLALLALLTPIMVQPIAAQPLVASSVVQFPFVLPTANTPTDKALIHLEQVMDKCHQSFVVYDDLDSPCNHFAHQARLEPDGQTTMDVAFTEMVHSGSTAIKSTFTGQGWGGWYLQNGVLLPDDEAPISNWGTHPNAGYDLTGATKLTFWARGQKEGEKVEFFLFGIGRNPFNGNPAASYPDSSPKVTRCGLVGRDPGASPCYDTLTNTWQLYTIPLTDLDLSYALGGFGWVTNDEENNDKSITFYLDSIQYDGPTRLDEPRFLVSFETISTTPVISFDIVNKNVGFSYDNALALIAFTAAGKQDRAKLLADAFLYCQDHDRFYDDGRLRDAYMAGDLTTPPGWTPNGFENTCRLPGWTDRDTRMWNESAEHVGSGTGNLAWVMIALLNYYEKWGGEKYLNAAITLGEWIETHTRDTRGAGGYTGGYMGWEPTPDKLLWKSTEHNLDLYVVFKRLCLITGNQIWCERTTHARNFVDAMWNENDPALPMPSIANSGGCPEPLYSDVQEGGFYWTGTMIDSITIVTDSNKIPLDAQTWALMALGVNEQTQRAIKYNENYHYVTYTHTDSETEAIFEGFDFNNDRDAPWSEGTGQMVVSYWILGEDTRALYYLDELRELQTKHPNGNGQGIVSAPCDGLTTGFHWEYFARLHVGATGWFVFSELKYNPYWPFTQLYLPIILHN